MDNETALPQVEQTAAGTDTTQVEQGELTPEQQAEDAKPKPEKTPEQREIERLRRGIDRRTRQLSDARAQLDLTRQEKGVNYQSTADDSEPLSLTRAQIAELVKAEASRLAPTIQAEAQEHERRQSVIQSLAKTWGQERFDELASDLDDAFGGLTDRSGRAKPAIEAVFESNQPHAVIEYLADQEHLEEAERISRMSAVQAGLAIGRLEDKLAAQRAIDKAYGKAKASDIPAPLSKVRGAGPVAKAPGQMTDAEYAKWRKTAKI